MTRRYQSSWAVPRVRHANQRTLVISVTLTIPHHPYLRRYEKGLPSLRSCVYGHAHALEHQNDCFLFLIYLFEVLVCMCARVC